MKLYLLKSGCIGCSSCADLAAAYFYMEKDGKASVHGAVLKQKKLVTELFPEDVELLKMVISTCPSRCIEIR